MASKLTCANINAQLQLLGLPAAALVVQPAVYEVPSAQTAGASETIAEAMPDAGGGGNEGAGVVGVGGAVGIVIGALGLLGGGYWFYRYLTTAPPTVSKKTEVPQPHAAAHSRGLQPLASPGLLQGKREADREVASNSLLGYVQSADYSPPWEQELMKTRHQAAERTGLAISAHPTPLAPTASISTELSIDGLNDESLWSYMYSPTQGRRGIG